MFYLIFCVIYTTLLGVIGFTSISSTYGPWVAIIMHPPWFLYVYMAAQGAWKMKEKK